MGNDSKSKEEKLEKNKKKKKRSSSSLYPSEDEGKSRKRHRRDEEKRKEKKSHKHRSDKEKKSRDKHKSKRRRGESGSKSDFPELSSDDYFAKNNEFATWLKEERRVFFSDLSSESARELFLDFIKEWNNQMLESRYYEGISSGPRTAHNWKIRQ